MSKRQQRPLLQRMLMPVLFFVMLHPQPAYPADSKVIHAYFAAPSVQQEFVIPAPAGKKGGEKSGLEYFFFNPGTDNPSQRLPLIYIHHGSGEWADDTLSRWKKEAKRNGFMLLVPQREKGYRNDPADLEELYLLLDHVIAQYPADPSRIYLAGVSAGGLIAKWLLMQNPKMWHGVILIASPPFRSGDFRSTDVRSYPPILYVHGWKDPQFDIVQTVECVEKLLALGVKVQLHDYKHGVHEHNPRWNKRIFEWLNLIDSQK